MSEKSNFSTPSTTEYDVCIIGAGVVGSAIARELSRFKVRAVVLERAEDVCTGTSKANSGIVHAGFDAQPGTLMAKYNVAGAGRMPAVCKELDVPYVNNGSLVLCFSEKDIPGLERLKDQGEKNGVKELEIIDAKKLRELEPHISPEAVAALWAKTAGIVDPFLLTVGFAENAADNGVEFRLNAQVTDVSLPSEKGLFQVSYVNPAAPEESEQQVLAKAVVNATGVFSGTFHNTILQKVAAHNKNAAPTSENSTGCEGNAAPYEGAITVAPAFARDIEIVCRRGSYLLLDMNAEPKPTHTLFQLPTKLGKGILVTPTAHGNTLIGPTAVDIDNPEGIETSAAEIEDVKQKAGKSFPDIPLASVITSFAGLRAHELQHEFLIGMMFNGYFEAAGIESPGLTSAPAIGASLAEEIADYLELQPNPNFDGHRDGIVRFADKTSEEQRALIEKDPDYAQIICRCETITEAEIKQATHRSIPVTTLDGVKRRVRAGMGRCQAGFCMPRVMEILSRENNLDLEQVKKSGPKSAVLLYKTKEER